MPTTPELIAAKVQALENVPIEWASRIANWQPTLAVELTKLLELLQYDSSGNIVKNAQNMARIETVLNRLGQFLTQGEYLEITRSYLAEFEVQRGRTITYFSRLVDGSVEPSSFASATYATKRAEALATVFSNNAFNELLFGDIRGALTDAIASGASKVDALEGLRLLAQGNDEVEGLVLRRGRTLVSDAFATTDRAFSNIIADDLGMMFRQYVGGLMDTSRCFCKQRNRHFYHIREIEAWGNGVDIGQCATKGGWAGRMPDTNAETIKINLGGYNCQHSILPVSVFSIPKEDYLRAVNKGYHRPTPTEREYFSI
jgi:hypothetical protein